jgi:hypothetical protein
MGGIERGASFPRSTMVGEREREEKSTHQPLGKKGAFYRSPTKYDRYSHLDRLKPDLAPGKAGQTG